MWVPDLPSTRAAGRMIALVCGLLQCGCSAAFWQGFGEGLASAGGPTGGGGGNPAATVPALAGTKLMIFGGEGHATYLGCLSCSQYVADSVFNTYGSHGSQYQAASIFNAYGSFGSKYSTHSACNPYATDPPVIVDGNGNFYGRLTVNAYHPQVTSNAQWRAWIAGVCAGH